MSDYQKVFGAKKVRKILETPKEIKARQIAPEPGALRQVLLD